MLNTVENDPGLPLWAVGFRSLESEVTEALPLEVRGALPAALDGTLYRIGPARHDVYGERFRSWFDGDGMVHALTLRDGRATYRSRFVATPGRLAEDRARARLFGGFATRAPGNAWHRFVHRGDRKNPANTNVVFHAGKLLALCEAGHPYRLDPVTLATLGEDDLSGTLSPGDTYSAHPKLDAATGEMWNFGLSFGRTSMLSVYRTAPDGATARVACVPLPFAPMLHDFALTARKAVFVIAPIALPRVPLGLALGQRSFAESLRWRPDQGVRIAVIDRATGAVQWHTTEAFMLFHTAHAWDEGDDVVVDLCSYPDAGIMRYIEEIMVSRVHTSVRAVPERLRIGADGRVTRTRLSDTSLEFPRVARVAAGRAYQRLYGVSWGGDAEFAGTPLVIDLERGTTTLAPLAATEYAGECVPVSKTKGGSEADVWLLSLVLDAAAQTTELRVFDGADLTAPAVATARLPHVVPFGFHGNWSSRAPA